MRFVRIPTRTTVSFVTVGLILSMSLLSPNEAHAQKAKKKSAKKQAKNETKGQSQLSGGLVKFGEIYTLSDKMNYQILRAKYSVEPVLCYSRICATSKTKLVVVDIAVKNASPSEMSFGGDSNYLTLVDESGTQYPTGSGQVSLQSTKGESFYVNLKPGQGLGQAALNNPLQVVFEVPLATKITKMFITPGRASKNESVMRLLMAGSDPAADPHNVIAPLPPEVADPADKSGATAMTQGHGKLNTWCAAGIFAYKLQSVTTTSDAIADGQAPEPGHKFAIATVVIKRLGQQPESIWGAQGDDVIIVDTDGEKNSRIKMMKASSTDAVRDA